MGNKLVSVGFSAQKINDLFEKYNPVNHLSKLSLNQQSQDRQVINELNTLNRTISQHLNELIRGLLTFSHSTVENKSNEILSILQGDYSNLINSLKAESTQYAKVLFKEWQLTWALNYLKDSTLLDDEDFARKLHIPIIKETKRIQKEMSEKFIPGFESDYQYY
jgi:hypothetical protein